MRMECPSCGSVNTLRAHRRGIEKLYSVFGHFPFLCVDCHARFMARAGIEEHRERRLLRHLAEEWTPRPEELCDAQPCVLITVQTVGQTGDLLRLLQHVNASRPTPDRSTSVDVLRPQLELRVPPDSSRPPDPYAG
jgi:hypothetical protein